MRFSAGMVRGWAFPPVCVSTIIRALAAKRLSGPMAAWPSPMAGVFALLMAKASRSRLCSSFSPISGIRRSSPSAAVPSTAASKGVTATPVCTWPLTAFHRDTHNLIDFISCFSVSDPLCGDGRFASTQMSARRGQRGLKAELGARVSERFRAQAVYSYVKAVNRTSGAANRGNDLARRPRHAVTVSVDWRTPLRELALGADIRMVSDSFDDAGNFTRLDSYALLTWRVRLPVSDAVELFGRVENLTDEQYQTAGGYGTPGRSAHFGARTRF